MRIAWVILGIMAAFLHVEAAEIAAYVAPGGGACPYPAMKMASAIFEEAGVKLEWRSPKEARANPTRIWLQIELAHNTPEQLAPGVLAVCHPFDRCRKGIMVFLGRVRTMAGDPRRESELLGYVLVHEITHLIQGSDVHTAEGIMKERWNQADREAIYRKRLSFSPEDLPRIRQGLSVDWCRPQVPLNDPPQLGTAVHPE
jgi:hypothetical protein